jgi:hypothetical protein
MTIPRTPAGDTGDRESVSSAARQTHDTADAPPSVPEQFRRRRAASWRCEPLPPDGRRDPLDPAAEPLTEREVDSWRAAWTHLHAFGLPAVVPDRVLADGSRVA